ncbi:MAG TPA: hypothetical protein VFP58_12255 [Candidatus Eisenbacteria bacterium]|nr:hypothetical protein [Candidatus Eisenbacteria bacterium]
MRLTSWAGISLSLVLSIATAPGLAQNASPPAGSVILTPEPDPTEVPEIRLIGTPSPEPSFDRGRFDAVQSFLAARQDGTIDPSLAPRVRSRMNTSEDVASETLFGPKGATLAAFDFRDEAIVPQEDGFRVPVYALFTDKEGRVVETRDESLTFSSVDGSYVCTELRATNVISWSAEGVREAAKKANAEWELDRVERHLREWSTDRSDLAGYSVSSVRPRGDGSFLVHCLRYESSPGQRGYRLDTSPIVLHRSGDSIRIGKD